MQGYPPASVGCCWCCSRPGSQTRAADYLRCRRQQQRKESQTALASWRHAELDASCPHASERPSCCSWTSRALCCRRAWRRRHYCHLRQRWLPPWQHWRQRRLLLLQQQSRQQHAWPSLLVTGQARRPGLIHRRLVQVRAWHATGHRSAAWPACWQLPGLAGPAGKPCLEMPPAEQSHKRLHVVDRPSNLALV